MASNNLPKFKRVGEVEWIIEKDFKKGMNVPVKVYATEKLLKEMELQVYEQASNVATLPGIQKYSFVMPDGHTGYGFCLLPEARILTEFGYFMKIKDFEDRWKNLRIKCYNEKRKVLEEKEINKFFKIIPNNKILKVVTKSGIELIATEDHPIYTKNGMKPLKDINVKEEVAVYPFEGVEYEEPSKDIIISEEDMKNFLFKLGIDPNSKRLKIIIGKLKKKNLLPLSYDNPKLPYILKIIGFLFGNGIMINKKGILAFFGRKEDLEDIRKDIINIGYRPTKIYRKRGNYEIFYFYLISFPLLFFLNCLGLPLGNKANEAFRIPDWIYKCRLWQKRLFLATLFGSSLFNFKINRKGSFIRLVFYTWKIKEMEWNAIEYLSDIAKLLHEFGVKIIKIQKIKEMNSRNEEYSKFELLFSSDEENLINLLGKIGFEYNIKRKFLSNLFLHYLKIKRRGLQDNYRNGLASNLKIFESGNLKLLLSKDFPFLEFVREAIKGLGSSGLLWDEIVEIKEVEYEGYVYDFTVNENHNFIANNFLVSNCVGGVAAFDPNENGVISPGGIGFDINCGMRLALTNLTYNDIKPYLKQIVNKLFEKVPVGVGASGFVKISKDEFKKVVEEGAEWCIRNGYGWEEDLKRTELYGRADWADVTKISSRAIERGYNQIGTLGAGNHYLEIQWVKPENIKDERLAKKWGLFPDQIVIMFHCLPGEAKIMTENNCWIKIKDLEKKWKDLKVKVFDENTHKLIDSEIESFYKLPAKENFYRIVTESGKEIVVTEDHPIMTKEGLKLPAELNEDDYVIIYPFEGVEYEEPKDEIIVDEKDIREIYNSDKVLNELKKRKLLPLKMNNSKLPILAKLLGFLLGNGYLQKSKKRWFIRVIGNEGSLKEIKEAFEQLGFNLTNPFKYGKIYQAVCNSTSLSVLLNCIGLPEGGKSRKEFNLPKWLLKAPKWIKRNFLAGFFGAELTSSIKRKNELKRFEKVLFIQYGCKKFLNEIELLLKEFEIKVKSIREAVIITKDKKKYVKFILEISSEENNLKKLWSRIGYEFNFERSRESLYALQFIEKQKELIKEHKFRNVNLQTFIEFVNNFKLNPPSLLLLDKIKKVEKIEKNEKFVYDIRVKNSNHNFIANNFVVGNCGSRGFGHEVASNYLEIFLSVMERKYGIKILDRELACAPFFSKEGQDYWKAMACAVNMSFANRQVILHRIREVFSEIFKQDAEKLGIKMVFDIAHNRASFEKHKIDGETKEVLVHRKGATGSYPIGREEIPDLYKKDGSPVIIGGSMETGSYLLVGSEGSNNTFCSTCHGSGRTMSRIRAFKQYMRTIKEHLRRLDKEKGIYIKSLSWGGAAEEVGAAYKNIDEVIEVVHIANISRKVAKLIPIGNIKG